MKKNIRQVAENFITVSDENFKGRIKATTSGSTHTLSYVADSGSVPLVAIDDSASTVTSYVDGTLMGTAAKSINKQTTTASIKSTLALGTAADENVGTSVDNLAQLISGSATSIAALPVLSGENLVALVTPASFPSGTKMLFEQTAAPTGWTKQTDAAYNDVALRCITGTIAQAGATAFATVFGSSKTTAGHSLITAELAAHSHSYTGTQSQIDSKTGTSDPDLVTAAGQTTGSAGSGTAHSHDLSLDVKYRDIIIASKD